MNTAPTKDRFEDRLLTALLADYDTITADTPTHAPTRLARHRRARTLTPRRVLPAMAGMAAAATAAVVGVSTLGSAPAGQGAVGSGGPITVGGATPAQLVAYRLASASAAAPATQGTYVVLAETDSETGQPGQSQRTSVIDTRTGASTTYQRPYLGSLAPAVLTEGPDATSTEAWFAALPTDPTALRARLLSLAKQQNAQAFAAMQQQAAKAGKRIPADEQPSLSDDDNVYQEADTLLWNPLVQPDLRAALYKVLATTGHYTVDTHAADPAGRPAIAMSHTDTDSNETDTTYENPSTGAVLAQTWKHGSDTTTAVYQPVTSSDTTPPDPYKN